MYCKNCGKAISKDSEICKNCGFEPSFGEKFCQQCGAEVLSGQKMCVKCGFMLESFDIKHKNKRSGQYGKYSDNVKRVKMLSLIMAVISLLTAIALILLPIYEYEKTPETFEEVLESFESIEDYNKYIENNGKIKENFSLLDEIKLIIGGILGEKSEPELGFINFSLGLMAIFELIFAIVLICMTIPQVFKMKDEFADIDKSTMLLYNEIKKTGSVNKKENIFKKQTIISIVIYAVFDIVFSKIEGSLLGEVMYDIDISLRNMINFSGFSGYVYIVAVLLIGYIVVSYMKKNEEKKLLEEITQEEYKK